MIYTLTLCFGMWGGMCHQIRHIDYPTAEACEKQRDKQLPSVRNGYALCAPKDLNKGDTNVSK